MLYIDFTNMLNLVKMYQGKLPTTLKVITRFSYMQIGQTIETTVDVNQFLAPIKATINKYFKL